MQNDNYTLITGASEGLGKSLAIECAARGMNLVLVALPGPELHHLADFIKRNYRVDVIVFEKDLTEEQNCISLFEEVATLKKKVNILINNAGIGSTLLFTQGTPQLYQKQIKLNIMATTLVTRLFIDMLKANKPAHVLNVGSLCCFFFLAKKQVYGGTKSFIYFFSKSLRRELKPEGIDVSVICPGGMNTNPSVTLVNRSGNWLARQSVMEPGDVAPLAMDGLLKGKEVIIPGRMNRVFLVLDMILPDFIKKAVTNRQMKKLNSMTALRGLRETADVTRQNLSLSA